MLLSELYKQVLSEYYFDEYKIQVSINEGAIKTAITNTPGGIIKGVGGFFKKHPIATALLAQSAVVALHKYNMNKRNTITFFGKSVQEKDFYKKMIKDLVDGGHYKVVKNKYVDGGKLWQLMRTRS